MDNRGERDRLLRLERTVTSGRNTWLTVGRALAEIKMLKLYRLFHPTFEEYCERRLNITRQHGHRLAKANDVVESIPAGLRAVVDTEEKARVLGPLTTPQRQRALVDAVEAGDTSAAGLKAAAAAVTAKPVLDAVGRTIPDALVPLWNRRSEVTGLLNEITRIKSALKLAQEAKDPLFAEVNFSAAIADLDRAFTAIQCAKPHAVCTLCQGHPDTQPDGICRMCLGRGLISQFRWDRLVPDEVKAAIKMELAT